jgi:(S)-ureidoglycine-glyoxylate aminotransferase
MEELAPSHRILLGPGPSMADPRVLRAMALPLLGQFDPEFTAIMTDVMTLSRLVFETDNLHTFPVSGTGRAGLEAAIASFVEPGERVVVADCGRFGLLCGDIAERHGAKVERVRTEWGRVADPDAIRVALGAAKTKMLIAVHGETSTGVLQPLEPLAELANSHGALLMVDAVVTLGGCRVGVDQHYIDVAVGGSQKCLSCPSGMAPVTYNARAAEVLRTRRTPIGTNYLDLGQIAEYWSPKRFNHHTAPTSMVYGLREALRAVQDEGLDARFERHRLHGDALRAGVAALGLRLFGAEPPEHRLPMLTPVVIPDGIDDARVRQRMLDDFGIEIGAAFGHLAGRIWPIGTMGYSAQRENVLLCLAALEAVLRAEGWKSEPGAGVAAAVALYAANAHAAPRGTRLRPGAPGGQ